MVKVGYSKIDPIHLHLYLDTNSRSLCGRRSVIALAKGVVLSNRVWYCAECWKVAKDYKLFSVA